MTQQTDTLFIWGVHPLKEALRAAADRIRDVLVLPSFGRKKNQKNLRALLEKRQVPSRKVSDFHRLDLPRGALHQGICAEIEAFYAVDLDELISGAQERKEDILLCDQIEDPQNLGALIRAAVAFSSAGIVIPSRQNARVNGTVVKASSGAIFHTKVCTSTSLPGAIDAIKAVGIQTVGLDSRGRDQIFSLEQISPVCVVLGSESKGIRKNVRENLDVLAKIPINPVLDSLNVSCAAAIALYEFQRQKLLKS